jgi:hypothetical protein
MGGKGEKKEISIPNSPLPGNRIEILSLYWLR